MPTIHVAKGNTPKRWTMSPEDMEDVADPNTQSGDLDLDPPTSQPGQAHLPKRIGLSSPQMQAIAGSDPASAGLTEPDSYAQEVAASMARVRQSMADISKPAQDLQQSVSYGVKQQPDKYAQLLQIEQQTGVKPQMSKDYQEYLKAHIDANSIDYNQFAADNPKTTDWASDPDNAAIAGVQEIQRLGAIEAQATNGSRLAGLTPSQQQAVIEDRQRVYWQRFEASHAAPGDVMARARSSAADITSSFFGFAKPLVDQAGSAIQSTVESLESILSGPTARSGTVKNYSSLGMGRLGASQPNPSVADNLEHIWAGGGDAPIVKTATDKFMNYIGTPILSDPTEYLRDPQTGKLFSNPDYHWYQKLAHTPGQVAGTMLAMSLVPGKAGGMVAPYLGAGAAQQGYQEAKEAGADTQTALATAGLKGFLTYVLMGHMPEVTPKWGVPGIVGQAAARSVVMGVGQTVGENLLSRTYEPDRPLFQGWQDNLSTMAAFEGIGAVHNVVNLAADSKLRERSKEKLAEGMAKATENTPLANMRIPVDRWDEYWQQQKQDPHQVAAGLGVSQGYAEAKLGAGGDDLVIPTSDFTAKLDPKHFTGLLPDMRGYDQFGRPTQTARELAEEQTPEGQARIAQAREDVRSRMQQADEETQSTPEWTEVKERIRQQMIAAGSTPEFAETQSTLEANVFANLGRPEGYNPVEAYEVMNPKVVRGEAPGFETAGPAAPVPAEPPAEGTVGAAQAKFERIRDNLASQNPDWGSWKLQKEASEFLNDKEKALVEAQGNLGTIDRDLSDRIQHASSPEEIAQHVEDYKNGVEGNDVLHQAAVEKIRSIVQASKEEGHAPQKAIIAPVHPWIVEAAKNNGLDIEGYTHVIDGSAVRHTINRHSNEAVERSRGQLPISEADFDRIPEIIDSPDRVVLGTKTGGHKDQIGYLKRLEDGTTLYLEEVRTGKKELATVSMRKYPAAKDFDAITDTLPSNARSDGERTPSTIVVRGPNADKPGPEPVVGPEQPLYQTAFHGGPYNFDKFSLAHIGTGEGAQAKGWGLYFAGLKAISEWYRKTLSGGALLDGKRADSSQHDYAESMIINMFRNRKAAELSDEDARKQTMDWAKTSRQILERKTPEQIDDFAKRLSTGKGQLYEADIPEAHTMLDWDKRVSEQPEGVRAALDTVYKNLKASDPEMLDEYLDRMNADWHELTGKEVYTLLKRAASDDILTDKNGRRVSDEHPIGDALSRGEFAEAASKLLHEHGVEGIKYLDGSSRAKGEGSHNYVVFDDNAINILQTYYQAQRGGGEGEGKPRGWSRSLPDGSIEVGRTDKADPTTDSHEWGHVYLKLIKKLIDRPGASDVLKRDHETILKFLGATDLDHLTREQHEKFTEAISLWRSQGKSASPSMRGVMQRFGIWLNNIFQKASDLGVKLSPEMNDFMERMHAAEEGIANARAEAGDKMFTSADQVGWTEEQFKQYAEDHQVSIEQAKETVLRQMNEARLREKTQDWRDEEKNARAAITEQIDQRPEYAAIRQLRKGAMDDGNPLTMNKDLLVKQFGEERAKALQKLHPGLYRADGGIEPETAAEMLGFTSAEEMMQALESTPRRAGAIEAATRQYMTQQHGDIRYDGTLGDQSRIALENEKLLDVKYRELQALRKKNAELQAAADKEKAGRRAITIAPQEDYRTFARETIAAKSPKEIQPARYLDASRKFSRMAFDALRRGDYEKAEEAKHKELVNHYMFTEAIKTQKYLEQAEANNKRDQRKSVQSKLGLSGQDHQDQFNYLAGRFGMGPETAPPERSLVEWANAMHNLGRDVAIDPSLFREDQKTHWRNLPVSQIKLIHEALTNIKKLAYQELTQVVNGKRIVYENAIGELEARARETGKTRPVRILKRNQTTGEWWLERAQRGDAMGVRMEFLMHELDGGPTGPWHDYLWHLSADSQGREMALHAQTTKLVGDAISNLTPEERKSRMEKVTIPGINETVTRHDLISWVFNMGNDGNLDRLRKTFIEVGWDPSVIPSLPGMLRPNELKFIEDTAKSLIPLGKEQFELERRQTGLAPVMVEPRPFTTTTADGTEMHMDGWYYPIDMDPRFSVRGALQDTGVTAQNMMEAGYGRAATSRGSMRQRTGFGGALSMDYEQILTQHVGKVVKDITYREFMLAANKMLTDPRIRRVLRERLGDAFEEQMMPWLRTQINDRNGSAVQGRSEFSKYIRVLRTNLVKAALTFKMSTILLQTTHASSVLLHVSPAQYGQSLIQFLASPKEMTESIKRMSPNEMRFRGDNYERDLRAMLQDKNYGKGFKAGYDRYTTTMAKAGMYPVLMMDHLLSFPLWHAAYQKALLENVHLSPDDAHYASMHKADGAVRMALGSSAPKDLPAIMRQNDVAKLLTMLGGFHNLKWNQIRGVAKEFGRDVRAGQIGKGAAKFTYGYAMAALIPSLLGAYVTGNGPKEGENVGWWAVRKALLFPAETIPIVGSAFEAIDRGEDLSLTPIAGYLARAYKTVRQIDPENQNERDWTGVGMSALQTAMEAMGVPGTDQLFKTGRYVRKYSNDQIENPNPWDAVMGEPHRTMTH